jgi:hypothetical protein
LLYQQRQVQQSKEELKHENKPKSTGKRPAKNTSPLLILTFLPPPQAIEAVQ